MSPPFRRLSLPYKEVLDIYNAGLQVPDDVTLIWCDDNYGYIRHFPTPEEQARKGGNGIYYHVSYWGRPHDYLWLGTFSPYLLYQQMKLAYDRGIQKMWVLNVGDIKPAEYQIELFLDMAWNIEQVAEEGVTTHLKNWLGREFGTEYAKTLLPVMKEHYRLAYIRKPEFMGNTREEERDPIYKKVKDLPWSEQTIRERLKDYAALSSVVEEVEAKLPVHRKDAYMQLVKYPVQAADQMNRKLLNAQLARHGKVDWEQSDAAFDSIASLTRRYNALQNGKWIHMMDFQPRKLPVFKRVAHETAVTSMVNEKTPAYKWNAMDCTAGNPLQCEGWDMRVKQQVSAKTLLLLLLLMIGRPILWKLKYACYPIILWMKNNCVSHCQLISRLRKPFLMKPKGVVKNGKKMCCAIKPYEK